MNWYKIFYWVTVADNVKQFFDVASNIFTWFAVIGFIVYVFTLIGYSIERSKYADSNDTIAFKIASRAFGWVFYVSLGLSMLTWFGYMASPSKKDALIIIAGGTVGNFITSDSTVKHIPAEAMLLLRDKIRAEIREVNLQDVVNEKVDTLSNKSKEELLKILKEQK